MAATAVLFGAELPPTGAEPSEWPSLVVAVSKLALWATMIGWILTVRRRTGVAEIDAPPTARPARGLGPMTQPGRSTDARGATPAEGAGRGRWEWIYHQPALVRVGVLWTAMLVVLFTSFGLHLWAGSGYQQPPTTAPETARVLGLLAMAEACTPISGRTLMQRRRPSGTTGAAPRPGPATAPGSAPSPR